MSQRLETATTGWLIAASLILLAVWPSCGARPERGPSLDLIGPRWLGVEGQATDVSPTPSLTLRFSEALDPQQLDASSVVIVAHEIGGACSVDLACGEGRCHAGKCQVDPVDLAWLKDAARRPLARSRLSRGVPLGLRLLDGGRRLLVTPARALVGHQRYTLIVGDVRDLAGNMLASGSERSWRFATAGPLAGRPTLRSLSPPAGAVDVPTNLARLVLRFDRPVRNVGPHSVWLEAGGERIRCRLERGGPCGDDASCYIARPVVPLPPLTEVIVVVSAEVYDGEGRAAFAGEPPRFATADGPDERPPEAQSPRVSLADRCLLVEVLADEPVDATLRVAWGEGATVREVTWTGAASRLHELGLAVPAGAATVGGRLELVDLAGNVKRLLIASQPVPSLLARVVIAEVLANPFGAEPAQELVELVNLAPTAVELGGWTIDDNDDGAGARTLPAALLGPGELAVLVGARYVPGTQDPAPPAEALVLRLDGTLGELGLANRGEPLVLRDAEGRLVSRYGGHGQSPARADEGRSVARVPLDACDVAVGWRAGPATPGWR